MTPKEGIMDFACAGELMSARQAYAASPLHDACEKGEVRTFEGRGGRAGKHGGMGVEARRRQGREAGWSKAGE